MFEKVTPEFIKQQMLSRLEDFGLQTREGSFTNDVLSAAAYEISEVYHSMDALIPAFLLDETSGKYIDDQAAIYEIYRKEGTKATCSIAFTGSDGVTVPAGVTFSTVSGLTYALDEDITIVGGKATGTLTAVNVGDEYNVNAGEIVYISKNYSGIDSFMNDEASGGTDTESDAAFLARFKAHLSPQAEDAYVGNAIFYENESKKVVGVAHARVFGHRHGIGTVEIVIANQDGEAVDDVTVDRCQEHIDEVRPIGANVTVVSAGTTEFSIEAEIILDDSTTKEAVQASLEAAVKNYLKGLVSTAFSDHLFEVETDPEEDNSYTVIYNRIYFMIWSTPGVIDCTSLTINGGLSNLSVPADCVPVLTGVTIT